MRSPQARPRLLLLATLTLSGLGQGCCPLQSAPTADPVEFCQKTTFWTCEREWSAERISDAEHEVCLTHIDCAGAGWRAGCDPLDENEASVCLEALSDPGRIGTPTREIPECSPSAICQTIEIHLGSP